MERYNIHQYAARLARDAAASIANEKLAATTYREEYAAQRESLGRAIATGERVAWELVDGREYREVATDNPLIQELCLWLQGERGELIGKRPPVWVDKNHGWSFHLFVADAVPNELDQWGVSGSAFDHKREFTLDEAARALTFEQTGRHVPALPTRLTPDGQTYHDWLEVLKEAANTEQSDALQLSVYDEDKSRTLYIQRKDLQAWCKGRGMRPAFLFSEHRGGSTAGTDELSAEDKQLSRRERQIEAILTAAAALDMDPMKIPDGGKAKIKEICLRRSELFTASGFDHAWKAACKAGKVRMLNDEKYKSKR